MERRSTLPSGIGMAFQHLRDTRGVDSSVDAEGVRPLTTRGAHGRPLSDAPMSAWLSLEVDGILTETRFDCSEFTNHYRYYSPVTGRRHR
jgi:hypothetical protein